MLITLCFISGAACEKKQVMAELPACIQQKINDIAAQSVWNPPATVYSYTYKGKTVYAFSANCCDQYNIVVDENCQGICAPSGGITGKGDGKCPDFFTERKNEKLIWSDTTR